MRHASQPLAATHVRLLRRALQLQLTVQDLLRVIMCDKRLQLVLQRGPPAAIQATLAVLLRGATRQSWQCKHRCLWVTPADQLR